MSTAAFTLLCMWHSHCCHIYTAATSTLLPHPHCWYIHNAGAFTLPTRSHCSGVTAKSSQKPSETKKISFNWNPSPKTNKSSHVRLQLSDECVCKTPFEAHSAILFENPTLPNEFCSFHWASTNFCDGPLDIHTAAAVTLLLHSHCCRIHNADTFTLLKHSHCFHSHTAATVTLLPHSHIFSFCCLLAAGLVLLSHKMWVKGANFLSPEIQPTHQTGRCSVNCSI